MTDDRPGPAATAPAPRVKHWYRAIAQVGAGDDQVKAGQEFDAFPDDVRVLSGYVVRLPDETPDEVHAAFDALEPPPD